MTIRQYDERAVPRRRAARLLLALPVLAMVLISACAAVPGLGSSVPQAVVNVPGNHTISTLTAIGNPFGRVVLCSDARTIVVVHASSPFFEPQVTWNGSAPPAFPGNGGETPATSAAFGPVDPGCGQFASGAFADMPPYLGPAAITFFFTRCDPASTLLACAQ